MQDTESAAVKLIHENEGRLESEVKNVMTIVRKLTRDSLFLLDETFASTGAADAVRLSRNLIEKICVSGCRCIFSTHLHDLAAMTGEINNDLKSNASRIDNLSVRTVNGMRTYEILRSKPSGASYADDIAAKYGLL